MFRKFITALIFAASPAVAQNPNDLTLSFVNSSLSKTETTLAAATNPTPTEKFALGAVRFLRGIEKTLQLRYRHNAVLRDFDLPVLRLTVPPNPNPEPFYYGLIADLFERVDQDMDFAREALFGIGEGDDVGLVVDLAGVWFDINSNDTRDAGESLFEIGVDVLGVGLGSQDSGTLPQSLKIRFDTADAAWLRAYTHVLSGVSDLVIAFDPTEMIAKVADANQKLRAIKGENFAERFSFLSSQEANVDMFAMVYGAINVIPDATLTRSARQHFLAMVNENRDFWRQVPLETDNDMEWLPNDTQTSAFGVDLPAGTSEIWLSVLNDGEAVLRGELLIPHWRTEPGGGINLAKLMDNPVQVDIVTWVHGYGLLPAMESGPLASTDSLRDFDRMFGGDAALFAFWLN